MNWKKAIALMLVQLMLIVGAGSMLSAQPASVDSMSEEDWQKLEAAVQRAVAYLLSQQHEDGQIVDNKRNRVSMTALAIMGMSSVGHKPSDDTKEGQAMKRALDYVLQAKHQDKDGYYGIDGSRMYGHGIITMMLAEMIGMAADEEQDKKVRASLQKAIDLIVKSQNAPKKDPKHEGGWRYKPNDDTSDLSVSAWQLIALRAAKNAGIKVPGGAIDKAVDYLKRSYSSPGSKKGEVREKSFFTYQPGQRNFRFGSAAAGLLVLQICGEYEAPEVIGAADYFLDYELKGPDSGEYFYYGLYYYAQGMYQMGGKYAEKAKEAVRDVLFDTQLEDGSWQPGKKERGAGHVFTTSMGLLSLSIHYHFLPIYQR